MDGVMLASLSAGRFWWHSAPWAARTVFYFDFNETPTPTTNPPSKLNEITWGWSKQNIKTSSIVIVRRLFGAKAHTLRGLKIRKLIRQIFAVFFFANQTSRKMLVVAVRRESTRSKKCATKKKKWEEHVFWGTSWPGSLAIIGRISEEQFFFFLLAFSRRLGRSRRNVERKKTSALSSSTELWYPKMKKFAFRCRKVLFTLPSDDSARIGRPRNRRKAHFCGSCRVLRRKKNLRTSFLVTGKIFISLSSRIFPASEKSVFGWLRERGNIASLDRKDRRAREKEKCV